MRITLPLLLILFTLNSLAQTYPFAEGFEGLPSNQPPTGWGGSMKVLVNHGINDYKAICARVSSAVQVDSSITPLIGPLTTSSVLSFYYRIIDQNIYPSTPTNLDSGDSIEFLLSADSVNYQVVYLITLDNHNTSFNFIKKKVFLSQFAGSSVNFKIRCHFGTGAGYYVDIDTVVVKDEPQTGVEDLNEDVSFSLYPNPAVSQFTIHSSQMNDSKDLVVFNSLGQTVLQSKIQNLKSKIDLPANWFPGLYFVQLGNTTRKLIIE